MRSDELRDTGSLTGTTLDEITELAQGVHRAVARRLFRVTGQVGEPIRVMHDGISAIAYGSTRLGVKYLPPVVGAVAGAVRDPAAESAHDIPHGRFVIGAVSGFLGDRMAQRQRALAPEMRIRLHRGRLRRLTATLAADAAESGNTTGRLVLFLHGLCETDTCWSFAAHRRWGDRTCTYGSMLRDDGWTPLYVNYNSGLRVSANARELAEHLEELVQRWPEAVTEIALVGHSMGGLIARSAAHQARDHDHAWLAKLRHVIGLAAPHLGVPLERLANWGAHRLDRLPETRPFATWLNRRSVGMKDMRYGALLEADWLGYDPDELLTDRCTPADLLPGISYCVASATLSRATHGPFAHDLLVQHSSAHGIGKVRTIPFEVDRTFHLGGRKHHFDLLADARLYEQLRTWLSPAAEA
jgi:pimeloyl-ACP methyl ester carboxylesterase